MERMKTLVWGAGAIGGTIAAYLVRAGHEVTLVDVAADHVAAMRDRGLEITGPVDAFVVPVDAFVPSDLHGTWDRILLCTKALHTAEATDALLPHLTEDGHVVSVQNGLNELIIRDKVGAHRTVGAFVNFGADYLEPGTIHFGGRGAFVVGELDGRHTPRLEALHALLLDFDANVVTSDGIWRYLWGKMGYGAMLFAGALCNESIADVLDSREVRPMLNALVAEILAVAAAEGVQPLGFNGFDPRGFGAGADEQARAASYDAMVAHNRGSAKSHSGVWRDLAIRKRKTEVDAQYGPILDLGRQHGVAMPVTTAMVRRVHDVEEGRAPLAWETLTSLADAMDATATAQGGEG